MERRQPKIVKVSCDEVRTGRNYRHFSKNELEDLLISIKNHGLLQNPIITSNEFEDKTKKPYELVAGERRFRCCEILKKDFEALFYSYLNEEEFIQIQLAENIKKKINTGEIANSTFNFYKELIAEKLEIDVSVLQKYSIDELPNEYRRAIPISDFAIIRGKSESAIRDYFAFASLDKQIQNLFFDEKLSYKSAVLISKLPKNKQLETSIHFNTNYNNLEKLIENMNSAPDDFSLEVEKIKNNSNNNELADYISSLDRIIKAGIDYAKKSNIKYNHNLSETILSSLDYLNSLRDKFEEQAKNVGKSELIHAKSKGKQTHKDYVFNKLFNLNNNCQKDLEGELRNLEPHLIKVDSTQPRKTFDDDALEELRKSIDLIGQQQPGMVYQKCDNQYQLIFGERRLRAILKNNELRKQKGLKEDKYLAKIVKNISQAKIRLLQYDEDFHEIDKPDERAEAIYRWQQLSIKKGEPLNTSEIIETMGIGRKAVKSALKFASASDDLKEIYQKGLVTYSSVAEISQFPKEKQKDIAYRVYLNGRGIKVARKVINEIKSQQEDNYLFAPSEIKSDFSPIFTQELNRYLNPHLLKELKKADIYKTTFIKSFYNIISNLENLKQYCVHNN